MKRNPIICLIISGLLVVSLAGQAAAALKMACEGTMSCCCRNMAATPERGNDPSSTGTGCCGTSAPQPCDLSGPGAIPVGPYLPKQTASEPSSSVALASAIHTAFSLVDDDRSRSGGMRPTRLSGPPIYLLVQTFLC